MPHIKFIPFFLAILGLLIIGFITGLTIKEQGYLNDEQFIVNIIFVMGFVCVLFLSFDHDENIIQN